MAKKKKKTKKKTLLASNLLKANSIDIQPARADVYVKYNCDNNKPEQTPIQLPKNNWKKIRVEGPLNDQIRQLNLDSYIEYKGIESILSREEIT